MRKVLPILFVAFILAICSCKNESEDQLTAVPCDSGTVTYSQQIKTLFDGKCISCHSGGASVCELDTYANAKQYVDQFGELLYNMVANNTHQGVNLTPCEKVQLQKWVANPIQQ